MMSVSITKHAANLLWKCAGYLDDYHSANRKDLHQHEIYYAIDPDVITLFMQPNYHYDYLDVFPGLSDKKTTRYLSFLMGDFLFDSSTTLLPNCTNSKSRYFLVPPHNEELIGIVSAIHRKLLEVGDKVDDKRYDKLSKLLSEYEQNRNFDLLAAELRWHVPELVELFNPYIGPKAALTRFAGISEQMLQRIDTYIDDDEFAFPILDPINNSDDRKIANDLMDAWTKRLHLVTNKRTYKKQERNINRDAEVLASIEHINKEFHDNNIKKRLILITGSKYLFDASSGYLQSKRQKLTFADCYLRHPQAFLAHPDFFTQPTSNNKSRNDGGRFAFKLIDWLNLFFPCKLSPAIKSLNLVRRDILRIFLDNKNNSYIFDNLSSKKNELGPTEVLLSSWHAQILSMAEAKYANSLWSADNHASRDLAKKLQELKENEQWSLENLRNQIFKESLISASKLYSTTVWEGLWREIVREEAKGVPAPRFDGKYEVIENYCSEVVRLQIESRKTITDSQMSHLRNLHAEVWNVDDTGYHAHIVHAIAYIAKGQWRAAYTLAKIALEICLQIPEEQRGYLKGREAAYLACISTRRSARKHATLQEAEDLLDLAVKLENEGLPEDIRFKSERLAIQIRRYYFDYFDNNTIPDAANLTAAATGLRQLADEATNESNAWVRHWVLRQSLTNYFSLLIIFNPELKGSEILNQKTIACYLEAYHSVLVDKNIHDNKAEHDPYAHMIYCIAHGLWGIDNILQGEKNKTALAAISEQKNILNNTQTCQPYAEKRLELFRERILTPV